MWLYKQYKCLQISFGLVDDIEYVDMDKLQIR